MSKKLINIGIKPKTASKIKVDKKNKNKVLKKYLQLINKNKKNILRENNKDIDFAIRNNLPENLISRLTLNDKKIKDNNNPKISAWSLFTFPVGMGLKHVRVINASKSDSYHIFRQPAAPAPIATIKIPIIEVNKSTLTFEVRRPTAQVNITRDITLGFINCNKDFK